MKIKLAFSPCPNDTFIFHAMIHSLVDCEGLSFDVTMADVEELNRGAFEQQFDLCKLSYQAHFKVAENYKMLSSGSALGWGNGPLLVAPAAAIPYQSNGEVDFQKLAKAKVLIPGKETTATLLLRHFYPSLNWVEERLFSDIESALLNGEALSGVIIHETRFKYQERGLAKISDLGEEWEKRYKLPLPLGGIALSTKLDRVVAEKIERVLRRSVEYAVANPTASEPFIAQNAQEIEKDVINKHIAMFVTEHTVDIGELGVKSVEKLYSVYLQNNPSATRVENLFFNR